MSPGAPTLVVRTRIFDGLLVGLAASGLAGVAWWAVAAIAGLSAWAWTSPMVGLVIAGGVLLGCRRGGIVPGLLAALLAVATVAVSVYFIQRSLAIDGYADAGVTSDIPLWEGFGHAKDVVSDWVELERSKAVASTLAPLLAFVLATFARRGPA